MNRYLCIHGHFYQPPRENPWLEAVEIQDSAHPYHDWNERISSECYAPNSVSRILDGEGRILSIISNYSRISFNFGPTLLSWMEKFSPEIYGAIIEADKESVRKRSGHGNALAQVYNHLIIPLANKRDKETQVLWGIRDFEQRFDRLPEGMWLSETAVDLETLDILAKEGIQFTILSPYQAMRVRKGTSGKWKDVSGGRIDPTRAYKCNLPSGRVISLFFYDGPISQAVAFEKLLNRGEDFANRLLSGFSDSREWAQLLHIATDGESYGHHHKFGDMAMAYALDYIESRGLAKLINYGEYLEKYPPEIEVEIFENSSWSCVHGIERWRSDCGCNSGGHLGWNQEWRGPLRDALDWLREELAERYLHGVSDYLKDPWAARNEYINIILDRSESSIAGFFRKNAVRTLSRNEMVSCMKLLEMQRHAMLMYTSCGWFFDELSGLETVQVMQYAGRAIQLSEDLFINGLENAFLERLARAKSNIPELGDGAKIFEKYVRPAMIDLNKVGVHYAISSLFEDYPEKSSIYCYGIERGDYRKMQAERIQVALGKITVTSEITMEREDLSFCVLSLGNHDVNGGIRLFRGKESFLEMKEEIEKSFEGGAFVEIVRLMDKHFGMHNYSLKDLFRDEQRKILNMIIHTTVEEFDESYCQLYEDNRILMGFLLEIGIPIPRAFCMATEFALNLYIKRAFEEEIDTVKLEKLFMEIKRWDVSLDKVDIEFIIRRRLTSLMERIYHKPSAISLLTELREIMDLLNSVGFQVRLWQLQNIYSRVARTTYPKLLELARAGEPDAVRWIDEFRHIGASIHFDVKAFLPG